MQREVQLLAQELVQKSGIIPASSRLLVGVAGIPASGKTSLARRVVQETNNILAAESRLDTLCAICVSQDGWHLSRSQLDAHSDPKLAHERRGIHWTFDADGYVDFVRQLRGQSPIVYAPSFDHAAKDPVPEAILIEPRHRIILIEGLYTFLSIEPWSDAGLALDERWFVQVDVAEAQKRLVLRHIETGICDTMDEAVYRAEQNDMPNGRWVQENMLMPTKTIQSIADSIYTSKAPHT